MLYWIRTWEIWSPSKAIPVPARLIRTIVPAKWALRGNISRTWIFLPTEAMRDTAVTPSRLLWTKTAATPKCSLLTSKKKPSWRKTYRSKAVKVVAEAMNAHINLNHRVISFRRRRWRLIRRVRMYTRNSRRSKACCPNHKRCSLGQTAQVRISYRSVMKHRQ